MNLFQTVVVVEAANKGAYWFEMNNVMALLEPHFFEKNKFYNNDFSENVWLKIKNKNLRLRVK